MKIRQTTILGFSLLLAGLALCGVGLWLLLSPAQYQATARIEINPDVFDLNRNGQGVAPYDPYLIQTEFEIIQSQAVLDKVINSLNLDVVWGREYAGGRILTTNEFITILKKYLKLAIVRNTWLIEISFTSDDPDEVAKIANAIAKAYQDYRVDLRRLNWQKGIQVIEEEYKKDMQAIKAKQESLGQLRQQLNVPNPEPADELLKSNYPTYFQVKQELQKMIESPKLLHEEDLLHKSETMSPEIPPPVQIVDLAQPPKSSASPNRFLGAVLLAIGLFPTVGGFLMLKSSRYPV